jgi:hypothetical protein
MDAAAAAAMSDPDRNPHFRRLWQEQVLRPPRVIPAGSPPSDKLGTLGVALIEAWRRTSSDRECLQASRCTHNPVEEDRRTTAAPLLCGK